MFRTITVRQCYTSPKMLQKAPAISSDKVCCLFSYLGIFGEQPSLPCRRKIKPREFTCTVLFL